MGYVDARTHIKVVATTARESRPVPPQPGLLARIVQKGIEVLTGKHIHPATDGRKVRVLKPNEIVNDRGVRVRTKRNWVKRAKPHKPRLVKGYSMWGNIQLWREERDRKRRYKKYRKFHGLPKVEGWP